jgi:hypothetical protein
VTQRSSAKITGKPAIGGNPGKSGSKTSRTGIFHGEGILSMSSAKSFGPERASRKSGGHEARNKNQRCGLLARRRHNENPRPKRTSPSLNGNRKSGVGRTAICVKTAPFSAMSQFASQTSDADTRVRESSREEIDQSWVMNPQAKSQDSSVQILHSCPWASPESSKVHGVLVHQTRKSKRVALIHGSSCCDPP